MDGTAGNAKNQPICGREVRLGPKSSQKKIYRKRTKIEDFIRKSYPPPHHFHVKMGGGGDKFHFVVQVNSDLTWFPLFEIIQAFFNFSVWKNCVCRLQYHQEKRESNRKVSLKQYLANNLNRNLSKFQETLIKKNFR